MSNVKKVLGGLVLATTLALGGCVVVISDEGISSDGQGLHWGAERADRADAALAERVRSALFAEPLLKDAELTVSADDGTVTLKGEVVDLPAFDRALQVARATEGVEKVVSRIRVELR